MRRAAKITIFIAAVGSWYYGLAHPSALTVSICYCLWLVVLLWMGKSAGSGGNANDYIARGLGDP